MRKFHDRDVITVEPFRATSFPVMRDLTVDRSAFDRIIQSGGFITERCGAAPDANALPIPKTISDLAMDARRLHRLRGVRRGVPKQLRRCSSSARKPSHLGLLPQGKTEKTSPGAQDGSHHGPRRALETARTTTPAKRSVRRQYPPTLSPGLNREYTAASAKEAHRRCLVVIRPHAALTSRNFP